MSTTSTIEVTDRFGASMILSSGGDGRVDLAIQVGAKHPLGAAPSVELDEIDRGKACDWLRSL